MLVIPSSVVVQKKTQLLSEKKRIVLILRVAGMVFSLKFNGQKVSYGSEWTSLILDWNKTFDQLHHSIFSYEFRLFLNEWFSFIRILY